MIAFRLSGAALSKVAEVMDMPKPVVMDMPKPVAHQCVKEHIVNALKKPRKA